MLQTTFNLWEHKTEQETSSVKYVLTHTHQQVIVIWCYQSFNKDMYKEVRKVRGKSDNFFLQELGEIS